MFANKTTLSRVDMKSDESKYERLHGLQSREQAMSYSRLLRCRHTKCETIET